VWSLEEKLSPSMSSVTLQVELYHSLSWDQELMEEHKDSHKTFDSSMQNNLEKEIILKTKDA